MKNYVITIMDNDRSCQAAERCIQSGKKFGIIVENFSAVTPSNNLEQVMESNGILPYGFQDNKFSRIEPMMAAFMSHFSLWKLAVETKQEITIFEHDAIILDPIPPVMMYHGCINLGKPSYGRWNDPLTLGVNPLTSKQYFPGAHAYRVNPRGAKLLIEQAKIMAGPTDVFLNVDVFPWLEEYYPWPVVANDSFTTIQNVRGCQAKHNYNDGYEII